MKTKNQEYLKDNFNIDVANFSNVEIEEKLKCIIEKNNKLIDLKQEKNRLLSEELDNMLEME